MDKLIPEIPNTEVQPSVEAPVQPGAFQAAKTAEAETLARNLDKAETGGQSAGLNILNMVIAGLIVGIPAYYGIGTLLDYFDLSAGTGSMVRLGSLFAMRPAINKLTSFVSENVINPVTDALSSKIKDPGNRQTAQYFMQSISNPVQPKLAT